MRVTPVRQNIDIARKELKTGTKYIKHEVSRIVPEKVKITYKEKMPQKITWDNFPIAVGVLGLFTPIPGASVALYGIAKMIQIARKKFLHKP